MSDTLRTERFGAMYAVVDAAGRGRAARACAAAPGS